MQRARPPWTIAGGVDAPVPPRNPGRTGAVYFVSSQPQDLAAAACRVRRIVTALLVVIGALLGVVLGPAALMAQYPPELRGRVVTRDGGLPLAAARIELETGVVSAQTDADGRFSIRGLQPGRRTLRVSALGYAPTREAVDVDNGRVTTITVALTPVAAFLAESRTVGQRPAQLATGATVVERAEIDATGARSLATLLDGRAGLLVTARGGPGAPATLSVRGGAADQLLVLVDGVEINQPVSGEADLSTIALATIERVTVLRGAQAARYGSRALAGVLLIETRRPGRNDLQITLDGGTLGERAGGLVLGGYRPVAGGGLAASANAELRRVTGDFEYDVPFIRGGGTAVRGNAGARSGAAVASATYERGDVSLGVRGDVLDIGRGMPGTIVQPSLTARQDQRRVSGALVLRASRQSWDLSLDVSAQQQDARFADPAPPFGVSYDDSVQVSATTAAASLQTVRGTGAFAAGIDLRRTRIRASALDRDAPIAVRQAGAWANARAWRDFTAVWPLRAELSAGLRADRTTLLDERQVMPRVGASVGGGSLTVRASWGRAFSPPGLADQFFQEGVQVRPNPDLRPERVHGEVEVRAELRDRAVGPVRLDAELSAYRADVTDMILWFPNFLFVWSPENQDARRRGWDLAVRAALPSAALELRGALSQVHATYAGPVLHGQIAYRPRTTASAGAAMTLAGMRTQLNVRYVGSRRVSPGSQLNALPAYSIADLRASRLVSLTGWTLDIGAGVENLFDQRVAILADYPQPGRRLTTTFRLQRGRTTAADGAPPIRSSSP